MPDLDAALGPFDVIIGMIYINDPRLDRPQQRLMGQLAERVAHPGTVFIPNRVRYVVTGYDSRTPDPTGHTRSADWGTSIDRIEGQTGLTLTAARRLVNPRWRTARLGLEVPPGRLTDGSGYPDRSGMTQLTGTEPFTEIGYSRPQTAATYPRSLPLTATRSGRIDRAVGCANAGKLITVRSYRHGVQRIRDRYRHQLAVPDRDRHLAHRTGSDVVAVVDEHGPRCGDVRAW